MKTLKVFGDSILKGVIYNDQKNKYCLCRDYKLTGLASNSLAVENKSRMGATIEKGFETLEKSHIDENTVLLLEYGGNDSDYNWKEISENPTGSFEPKTPENIFTEQYGRAIELAKSKGAQIILSTLIPIDAEKYMNWISKNLNRANILSWLGDVSMLYRWQEYYSHLVERIAVKFDCQVVDLRSSFLLDHNYKALLCADGIHPTQAGHDKIEQTLAAFINA